MPNLGNWAKVSTQLIILDITDLYIFLYCQAAVMISLIWKYYSDPVTVVPSKWIAPVERLVAFPTGVAGKQSLVFSFVSYEMISIQGTPR